MGLIQKIQFSTIEKYFFFLVVGLNLLPILSYSVFPTMDGAAHLYNANIIQELLRGNKDLANYYIFNPDPVPNWIGHGFLGFLNSFLPAFTAEKILLLSYFIGLPLAFRSLIKTISPNNQILSYLIFPFTYSFAFYLGFYNFSLAIILVFITLNYYIRNEDRLTTFRVILPLGLLVTLTFFSHLFVFALLLLFIGIRLGYKTLIEYLNGSDAFKTAFLVFLKKTSFILLAVAIPLVLFFNYLLSRPAHTSTDFIETQTLIDWIKNLRPIIALNELEEQKFTRKIFYVIAALFIYAIASKLISCRPDSNLSFRQKLISIRKKAFTISDFWLIATVIIAIMYFTFPDSDGSAGYVSVRLGLIFFLFLILWLSSQKMSNWFLVPAMALIVFLNFKLNKYYSDATKDIEKIAIECKGVADHIEANSTVLPLQYLDNWLTGHFSNYLGVEKPLVILENYECVAGYFPLQWNVKSMPDLVFGNIDADSLICLPWQKSQQKRTQQIDYIFVIGKLESRTTPCDSVVKENLSRFYHEVHSTEHCSLYKSNN